jgi:hypothetical protein
VWLALQVVWLALHVLCSLYDRHDITEILLKVALNTIKSTSQKELKMVECLQ